MRKIKKISDGANRTRDLPLGDMQKQLNQMFLDSFEKEQQQMLGAIEAEKELEILRGLEQKIDSQVWDVAADAIGRFVEERNKQVCFKVGDNSGQPNANGDIFDWSGCENFTTGKVVVNECNTVLDGETIVNDSIYVGDYDYSIIGDYPYSDIRIGDIPFDSNPGGGINWTPPPHHKLWTTPPTTPPPSPPYTITTVGTGTGFNLGFPGNEKYAVMDLPRKDVPMAVLVCGRMVTLGILGTEVECAFTGDKLVFEPGVIRAIAFDGRITVSIEYDNEIIHYNIGEGSTVTYINERSSTLEITLVSTIKKKVGSNITGAQ